MTPEESVAQAERMLGEAGWRPIVGASMAGRFVAPELGLVGGRPPGGAEAVVKCWTAIPPGHELHDENTPDEPHEAAAWLVARYPLADAPEAEETPAHEAHSETGEAETELVSAISDSDLGRGLSDPGDGGRTEGGEGDRLSALELADMDGEGDRLADEPDAVLDADFSIPGSREGVGEFGSRRERDFGWLPEGERAVLELGQELTEEHPEEFGGSQFIFGDNLAQKRTAAIGLVMQRARALMPFWSTDHDTALKELRNFVMGVSESRWPDDPERRDELDQLEGTRRRINAIEAARDAKVAFLESATREEVEAFDPEADWP